MTTVNDIMELADVYAFHIPGGKASDDASAALRAAVEALVIGHESSRTSMLEMLAKHKAMAQELEAAKADAVELGQLRVIYAQDERDIVKLRQELETAKSELRDANLHIKQLERGIEKAAGAAMQGEQR